MPSGMNSTPPKHRGPGRPRGRKDTVPRSFKSGVIWAYEQIEKDDPAIIQDAIIRGLKGKPKEAFPYVMLWAHYKDGKPVERHEVSIPDPVRVVHELKVT